jgi:predicted O-methyltransferase YrrM
MTFTEFRIKRLRELIREPRCHDAPVTDGNRVGGLIKMILELNPSSVIEIGSHRGVSTEVFCLLCRMVIAVDPMIGDVDFSSKEFTFRCGDYPNLRVVKGYSPAALSDMPHGSFDLVYIDAEHDYESVKRDIAAAYPLIRPGGHLTGHDHSAETDVPKAVEEFITAHGGGVLSVYPDTSWAVQKQ